MSRNLQQRMGAQAAAPIASQIQNMEEQFKLAMPKGMEAKQLIRDALTCLRQTPQLQTCSPASVLGSLMTCAQLGLRPGVLGHAYLIPFKGKATLVIGYQGLVELAHRSGKIQSLSARTVHENDYFDVDYGLEDNLTHKPEIFGDRGVPIAYYAVAKFKDGGHNFIVISHTEMTKYRDTHALSKTGPWVSNFEAMAHKTCVRQLAKWLPKSTELENAMTVDNQTVMYDAQRQDTTVFLDDSNTVEMPAEDTQAEIEQTPTTVDMPPANFDAGESVPLVTEEMTGKKK